MTDNFFKGKNVVVTGRMHKTRAAITADLTEVGANVQTAVRHDTDYLICGADVGATKTRAAEAKGIKMLNANDYKAIMRGESFLPGTTQPIKPKMTHEEFIASLPDDYGAW